MRFLGLPGDVALIFLLALLEGTFPKLIKQIKCKMSTGCERIENTASAQVSFLSLRLKVICELDF